MLPSKPVPFARVDVFEPGPSGCLLESFHLDGEGRIPAALKDGRVGARVHVVRHGETWHGIAKRLTGDVDPGSLLGRVHRLREVNQRHSGSAAPLLGATLNIPSEWPAFPQVDQSSPAGARRVSLLAVDEMEKLREALKHVEGAALQWEAIQKMSAWGFIRWAWRWLWRGWWPAPIRTIDDVVDDIRAGA